MLAEIQALPIRCADKTDFESHPAEIRIPMAALADVEGKKLRIAFDNKVPHWPNPPPGTLEIDNVPGRDVTL